MYLFPALFILTVIPSICKGLPKNTCDVVPKDQYIEVGSDIMIACQTSCVHGKVFWTLDSKHIDESLSNTINSSHTVLLLRNFTQRSATLQCNSADTKQILGGTTIRTYSKPSNLSCTFHYKYQTTVGKPELFTCSWKHQTDSSLPVTYTLLCNSSPCPSLSENCTTHKTTCTYESPQKSSEIPLALNSTITVRAKSALWETFSDPYEFNPYDILKITQPRLKVTAFPDHLLVEWKIRSRLQRKYHCQVKYSEYSEAGKEGAPERVLANHENKEEVTIDEVESCSNYTVAARCALNNAPWSEWSQQTVLTKLKKSDVKLRLWRKVAEANQNGVRKVHVMWTEIPSTCQDTFIHTIKLAPYKEHMTGVNYEYTSCGSSTCDVDVNQDAHTINLTVFHNGTQFVEDSVYVPAVGESLPQVTDIQTPTVEGGILVSWRAPVQPVIGYMIDYTHNGNQYYWKETKYTNATLFDLLDKKPYNITVTPLFDDKTGQSTQALQVCYGVGDPGNVTIINVQANNKNAHVSWIVKSQDACSGVVINYTVFYSTEKERQLITKENTTQQDIFLKDLKPGTQYLVYVQATALTGTTKSEERFFVTKKFDPRLITALNVCGGIFIIFVLFLGLCCAVQWKKFKEKPVPNPGLSSLASWQLKNDEKGTRQAFSSPLESPCVMVYTEESQKRSNSPLTTSCTGSPTCNQMEEYTEPTIVPAPNVQNESPVEPLETQHPSTPGETTELLSSENSPSSPYRTQSPVETPAPKISKQCKRVSVKQQEKTPPLTVYVTLDMFEQGQGR